jgi:hypothetical protein
LLRVEAALVLVLETFDGLEILPINVWYDRNLEPPWPKRHAIPALQIPVSPNEGSLANRATWCS